MRQLIYTLLLAFAFCSETMAQASMFQETTIINSEINGNNRYDDDMLSIVFADGGDRLLTYKMDITCRVSRVGGRLLITIDNNSTKLNGDYKYKGFSINHVVMPSVFDAEFLLITESGTEVKRWQVETEEFTPGRNMVRYYYDENVEEPCSLRIASIDLHFSRNSIREADEFVNLVDNYFNTDAHLQMIETELNQVRTDTLELLEQFHQMTINNTSVFNKIRSVQYASKLDLATYDPINLMNHVSKAEQLNRNVKKKLEYTLSHMHEAYYAKGMDWLNWGKGDRAEEMFQKSIETKHNYAPPHYQLALMNFNARLYYTVLDTCASIIKNMNPDSDTRYNTIKLSERVIYIFLDSVNNHIANQDVDEGFRMLSVCKDYCRKIKGIRNFEEFDKLSAQLYGTIHAKLIKQAQEKFEASDLRQSTALADSAANLRAEYPTFDIDDKAESKLLNDLYVAWINYGKKVSMEQADEALFAFDQATIICQKHKAVECTSELERLAFDSRTHKYTQDLVAIRGVLEETLADSALMMIDNAEKYQTKWGLKRLSLVDDLRTEAYQIKYDGLMLEGDNAMQRKKPREALAFYSSAMAINKAQPIIADSAWVDKNKKATIQYVLQLCSLGISYANMLQMGNAGQQYNTALAIAENGMVTKNKEVQAALSELSAALSDGECSKAWFDYNIQVGAAERLIKQKEFIKARTSLSKAAAIARANYKCNLTDSVVMKRSTDIELICKYQELINSIQPMLEQKEFTKALETYVEATEFFNDSCQNKFGIKHKPVYDYVFENQYSGLIDCAVIYLADKNELSKALKLLDELYRRYYESMWARESQSKLGIELARRDFRRYPTADPKLKVLDYTRNEKWFNNLKKAYLQEWIDNSTENLKSNE